MLLAALLNEVDPRLVRIDDVGQGLELPPGVVEDPAAQGGHLGYRLVQHVLDTKLLGKQGLADAESAPGARQKVGLQEIDVARQGGDCSGIGRKQCRL